MSVKALSHVWESSKQKGPRLLVLLAIADGANDDGFCWYALAKLAKKARQDAANTRGYIQDIAKAGELLVYERKTDNQAYNLSNLYKVVMPGTSETLPDLRGVIRLRLQTKGTGKSTSTGTGKSTRGVLVNLPVDPLIDPLIDPFASDDAQTPSKESKHKNSKRTEIGGEKDSSSPRPRNLLFDAVAEHVFGIGGDELAALEASDASRIGIIASWLGAKNSKYKLGRSKKPVDVGMISREASPEHVAKFASWWKQSKSGADVPRDIEKFVEHWRAWATSVASASKPRNAAPVNKPVEISPEELAERKRAAQAARDAMKGGSDDE